MVWDKDNPPAEYWGSDIESGSAEWAILPPEWQDRASRMELGVVVLACVVITFFGALWHLLLFVAALVAMDWLRRRLFSRAPGKTHALYYQCFRDGFRVRADVTGPVTLKGAVLRQPETRTTRFTDEDVRTLTVSRVRKRIAPDQPEIPAIQLEFTLHDGTVCRHSQVLHGTDAVQLRADLPEFEALLGRLETILGPARIDTPARLQEAREAVQRALQVSQQPGVGIPAGKG